GRGGRRGDCPSSERDNRAGEGVSYLRGEVRKPESGQTMVEFAMVVAAFVLVTFAAVSAAFHAIQRAMAETAAASGVQIAAGGSAADPRLPSLGSPEAFDATRNLLRPVAFGTAIAQGPASAAC